jgi:hypothetical protein
MGASVWQRGRLGHRHRKLWICNWTYIQRLPWLTVVLRHKLGCCHRLHTERSHALHGVALRFLERSDLPPLL